MSVFIRSKTALEFDSPRGEKKSIPSNYVGTVPDWVPGTWLFKAACQDGTITFIGEQKTQIVTEQPKNITDPPADKNDTPNNENEPPADETAQEFPSDELIRLRERAKELGVKNYQNMKEETLKQRIAEAEAKLQEETVAVNTNQVDLNEATTEERQGNSAATVQ